MKKTNIELFAPAFHPEMGEVVVIVPIEVIGTFTHATRWDPGSAPDYNFPELVEVDDCEDDAHKGAKIKFECITWSEQRMYEEADMYAEMAIRDSYEGDY